MKFLLLFMSLFMVETSFAARCVDGKPTCGCSTPYIPACDSRGWCYCKDNKVGGGPASGIVDSNGNPVGSSETVSPVQSKQNKKIIKKIIKK